jgi:hypothetical protein
MQPPAEGPPGDPEQWTDEQWIEWLKATDDPDEAGDAPVTPMGRVTRSSGGQVLGQAMLGMANAVFGRQDDEVMVVEEAPGGTGDDEPFTVHLDAEHPERSTVVVRQPPPPDD